MSLSGREFLHHILDEAEYLCDRSRGLPSEEFLRHQTRRAFVRSLEIIGEAAKGAIDQSKAACLPAPEDGYRVNTQREHSSS